MTVNGTGSVCSQMLTYHPDILERLQKRGRKSKWLIRYLKEWKGIIFLYKPVLLWGLRCRIVSTELVQWSVGQYLHLTKKISSCMLKKTGLGRGALDINARKQTASKGNFPGLQLLINLSSHWNSSRKQMNIHFPQFVNVHTFPNEY